MARRTTNDSQRIGYGWLRYFWQKHSLCCLNTVKVLLHGKLKAKVFLGYRQPTGGPQVQWLHHELSRAITTPNRHRMLDFQGSVLCPISMFFSFLMAVHPGDERDKWCGNIQKNIATHTCSRGGSRGRVQGVHPPPPPWDDLQLSNTTGIIYITSQLCHSLVVHHLLRKFLDPPLHRSYWFHFARATRRWSDRPLSLGSHVESQENKKLCFCTASLALNSHLNSKAFYSPETQHGPAWQRSMTAIPRTWYIKGWYPMAAKPIKTRE